MDKQKGTIRYWSGSRGFGFIGQNRNGEAFSAFFHASQIVSGTPMVGAQCLFNESTGEKGPIAKDVEVLGGVQ
jgi:cold shock CspA family protein